MTRITRWAALALLSVTSAACIPKLGNGDIQSQQRLVPPFTRIAVESGLHLSVSRGEQSVGFTTDSNLLPYVVATVEEGTLQLGLSGPMKLEPTSAITASVVVQGLEGVVASAAAEVVADTSFPVQVWSVVASGGSSVALLNVSAQQLSVVATVGSRVDAQGAALQLTVSATGGSEVDTAPVQVDTATVQASGSSTLRFRARQSVQGSVTEQSQLFISGNSTSRSVSKSDDARITWLDE